jgi:hypothetical protein
MAKFGSFLVGATAWVSPVLFDGHANANLGKNKLQQISIF